MQKWLQKVRLKIDLQIFAYRFLEPPHRLFKHAPKRACLYLGTVDFHEMPFECFAIEAQFKIVCDVRDRKVEDFFLALACGVYEVYVFNGVVAVVPSHVKWTNTAIGKGGKNINRVMKNIVHNGRYRRGPQTPRVRVRNICD